MSKLYHITYQSHTPFIAAFLCFFHNNIPLKHTITSISGYPFDHHCSHPRHSNGVLRGIDAMANTLMYIRVLPDHFQVSPLIHQIFRVIANDNNVLDWQTKNRPVAKLVYITLTKSPTICLKARSTNLRRYFLWPRPTL